jgi:DNA-binding beta-propeller fold protein YncE
VTPTGVTIASATVIASGYSVAANNAALVLGPTGLAYDPVFDVLFVASTNDNMIFAVPHAGHATGSHGTGFVAVNDPHLRGPLALALAPDGDLLTANGDAVNADPTQPSELVEFTRNGRFVRQFNVDSGQGGAFGLNLARLSAVLTRFAFVDDVTNEIVVVDQPTLPIP